MFVSNFTKGYSLQWHAGKCMIIHVNLCALALAVTEAF